MTDTPQTDRDHVAACIKSAMDSRTLNISDAAKQADISRPTLYKILQGKVNPSTETLYKIARGWDYPELFTDLELVL